MSVPPHGGAVVRQGHLRKLKTMKRKFFVLRGEAKDASARLEYYESEKKCKAGAAPRRVIPLKSCFNISRRLDLKQKYVIMLCTKEEQFCVVAEGEEELHGWLSDILRQHQSQEASEELLHPTQHVWQVNVQKKGLGASKNIIGLYNLCLTDKTLSLVKIKGHNNVITDFGIPEKMEFSLRNIRRCGDSECFFYMEVGRQTATGAGELWMHTDDANIAQSMHSTIYHAMTICGDDKDIQPLTRNRSSSANEDPRPPTAQPVRRQTYSDSRGRAGLTATANENQPPNTQIQNIKRIEHHRTISLPTGTFLEPLRIVHERTRSAPLTGDELDHVIEKPVRHSSCKTVNGLDATKKMQWPRRASTGTRFSKLSSPAHSKNIPSIRNRCDSMPSRVCPPMENERTQSRVSSDHVDGIGRDELDATGDWNRTPRIPEEPDYCEMNPRDNASSSIQHSRNSSIVGADEGGYLPMLPTLSASSGSVSGTPSTDPRFSEYQLEPATSHLTEEEERPPRAYSVGSRPCNRHPDVRNRAYSVGARTCRRPTHTPMPFHHPTPAKNSSSAPLLPRTSNEDLMELDFSPKTKSIVSRTPPTGGFVRPKPKLDEYVDMSPRSGYVEMRPSEILSPSSNSIPIVATPVKVVMAKSPTGPVATTPDGYVQMNYGKKADETPARPLSISSPLERIAPVLNEELTKMKRNDKNGNNTPLGSQTLFPISLESPASQEEKVQELEHDVFDDEIHHHPLTTVREISEEGRKSPEVGSPPHYITLAKTVSQPIAAPPKLSSESDGDELSCNPTATKTWAGDKKSRFEERKSTSPAPEPNIQLNYAALDLEPSGGKTSATPRTYTQIDFCRSEQLNAADST